MVAIDLIVQHVHSQLEEVQTYLPEHAHTQIRSYSTACSHNGTLYQQPGFKGFPEDMFTVVLCSSEEVSRAALYQDDNYKLHSTL